MKLVSAVSHAGGQVNEDAWGMVGNNEDVEAAWVLDGVTGINTHNYLPGQTDAAWFVEHAHTHLLRLTAENHSLDKILANLVDLLIEDGGLPVHNLIFHWIMIHRRPVYCWSSVTKILGMLSDLAIAVCLYAKTMGQSIASLHWGMI